MKKSKFPKEFPGDYTESWSDENINEYRKELDIEIEKDTKKIKHCYGITVVLLSMIFLFFKIFGLSIISYIISSVLFILILIVAYNFFKYRKNIMWNSIIKTFPKEMYKIKK